MVIDAHCHIMPPGFKDRRTELSARDATFKSLFANENARMATAQDLIEAMDSYGISRAVVMGMGWTDRAIARESNDYIIESIVRYPDRLSGFCAVNPLWADDGLEELERCAAAGLSGIGELHADTQGFDITDEKCMFPLMDTARRLGIPVLVHSSEPVGHQYPGKGDTTPGRLYRFIENFPDNNIICAHWGGGLPFYALMPEVPQVIKNVYFDMAASPFLYGPRIVRTVVDLVGPEKVLFGTDFPLIRPQRLLRQVERAGLEPEALGAITSGNAARLLGLQEN